MHAPPDVEVTNRTGLWERLIRFGFRLLYHELAWSYDLVAWLVSFGQWRAWGRTALPHLVGERVLELGHGPGHLQITLAQQGFWTVGLDQSPQMGRLARRRLRRAGSISPLVRGRAQTLPFADHSFDSVVAIFPTAYVLDPATLANITRILKAEGRLVIVAGARLSGTDPLSRFIEWLYLITGQRETIDAWQTPFAAAGLAARQAQVKLERSCVYLLIAERATPGDRD